MRHGAIGGLQLVGMVSRKLGNSVAPLERGQTFGEEALLRYDAKVYDDTLTCIDTELIVDLQGHCLHVCLNFEI